MKKVFISQPMKDKSEAEILAERKRAAMVTRNYLGEDVEVIDSIITDAPAGASPLWYLAKSLELMAGADIAVFVKGWRDYRGCRIERICAFNYGIRIIEI